MVDFEDGMQIGKGSKWPAEGPELGFNQCTGNTHTLVPQGWGATKFESAEIRVADWC